MDTAATDVIGSANHEDVTITFSCVSTASTGDNSIWSIIVSK